MTNFASYRLVIFPRSLRLPSSTCYNNTALIIILIILIIMEANIAAPIPEIVKPAVKADANKSKSPLITNVKSPKVKILTGNDNMTKIGFINALTTPIIIAATIAAPNPVTCTPLIMCAVIYSATAFIKVVATNPPFFESKLTLFPPYLSKFYTFLVYHKYDN